ncbi:MAG: GntR family transcriptional regulator [Bacteroidales bacterium]|nr:GntR family transcriptional regulator [Bacteroidales bacterium]
MKFQDNAQPIFMQIFDLICDKVLKGEIEPGGQITSVRELAVELEVNPNTVQRAIERLLMQEIIYSQRGKGNFLTEGAREAIIELRTRRLLEEKLPLLAEEIKLLGFTPEHVAEELKKHI